MLTILTKNILATGLFKNQYHAAYSTYKGVINIYSPSKSTSRGSISRGFIRDINSLCPTTLLFYSGNARLVSSRLAMAELRDYSSKIKNFFSTSTGSFNGFNIIPDSYSGMLINPSIKVGSNKNSSPNDSLDLNSGEFKYLHDVKLRNNVKWEGGDFIFKDLGSIEGSNREQLNFDTIINNLQLILNSLNKSQSYSIIFMVQSGRNTFTLDRQYLINFDSNIKEIFDSVIERMEILSLKYGVSLEDRLGCKYRPLSLKVQNPSLDYHIKPITVKSQTQVNFLPKKLFSNKFIPHSMDLRYYGALLKESENKRNLLYIYNNNAQLLVTLLEPGTYHKVDVYSKDGSKLLFTYVDERFDGYFIRAILYKDVKHPIYFKYDFYFNLLSMEFEHDFSFMTRTKREMVQNKKIMTFDIETYLDKSKNSIPYSCGFYDGGKYHSYYLSDFLSSEAMLLKCIADMMDPKYKGYTVYVHNFANFDSIFIYKLLYTQYNVKFLSKDQNFLSLTISSLSSTPVKSRSQIIFRDSAKLLLGSLKDLGKSFNVPVTKGIFPYSFVNASNLEYVGSIPSFNFYNQDVNTKAIYSEISKNCTSWSLRNETLFYLEKK